MRLLTEEILLSVSVYLSAAAYNDRIQDGIRIQSRLTSCTAFVVKVEDLQAVVFRGTKEPRDWLYNALAIPFPCRGRLCHAGFLAAQRSVWGRIQKELDPEIPLVITGHSLGGACAEATALLATDYPEIHLVTFGKPNLFFKPKTPALRHLKTQLSVVSGSDLVTRVPRIFFGPDPGQAMLYLANCGEVWRDPQKQDRVNDWSPVDSISDHSMDVYTPRVQQYLEERP